MDTVYIQRTNGTFLKQKVCGYKMCKTIHPPNLQFCISWPPASFYKTHQRFDTGWTFRKLLKLHFKDEPDTETALLKPNVSIILARGGSVGDVL